MVAHGGTWWHMVAPPNTLFNHIQSYSIYSMDNDPVTKTFCNEVLKKNNPGKNKNCNTKAE